MDDYLPSNPGNLFFTEIAINGYRGRKFLLKMQAEPRHSVFEMDGNTGKTTTIELLRWCFKYRESLAYGKFNHMWVENAHILDDTINGKQSCSITIQFYEKHEKGEKHYYRFTRETIGEFITAEGSTIGKDNIFKITDLLDIDSGKKLYPNDEAQFFLSKRFRLDKCADWLFFDGEKAREVLISSGSTEKINFLISRVNERLTNPKLEYYSEQLIKLKKSIMSYASTSAGNRSDVIMLKQINKLSLLEDDIHAEEMKMKDCNENIAIHSELERKANENYQTINNKVVNSKVEKMIIREQFSQEIIKIEDLIKTKRQDIYRESDKWFDLDSDFINDIKQKLKEKGKLPEPYRQDLIKSCLDSKKCDICGQSLNENALARIKELGIQAAPHGVHEFLSDNFSIISDFEPENIYSSINNAISQIKVNQKRIEEINLSDEDSKLIKERDEIYNNHIKWTKKLAALYSHEQYLQTTISVLNKKRNEELTKISALKKFSYLFKKIEEAEKQIKNVMDNMRISTIHIISDVIDENIKSILGPTFSASLTTKNGLLLGENGSFGVDKGGYSGRLMLSYLFAESVKTVNPIIIDTPVGNVGSHREKLAKHLVQNNNQIIVLCLNTELHNFGKYIDQETIQVKNDSLKSRFEER